MGGHTLRSILLTTLIVLAATALAHPASADCGVIQRNVTVPAEGASVDATLVQCSSSYSSGTYSEQYTYNDTRVQVYDATTSTWANVDDNTQAYSYGDSAYDYAQTQRAHGYSAGASSNGVSASIFASESKYSYDYGGNSGCFGSLYIAVYHWTPVDGSTANENVPMGDGSQLPCMSDENENLLP